MRKPARVFATIAAVLVLIFATVSAAIGISTTSPRAIVGSTSCEAPPAMVLKIAIMGDSLTTPYGASTPEKSWPVGLRARGSHRGWAVELHGIGSTMASQYLPGGPHFDVTERVRDWRPDWVLMDWRANEQLQGKTPDELKASLLALAGQIRASSMTTRFMIVNPPLFWYHEFQSPDRQHTYTAKLREVADELGGVFVDLEPFFPQAGPSVYSRATLFDDIHPNDVGHERFLTVIYVAMRKVAL